MGSLAYEFLADSVLFDDREIDNLYLSLSDDTYYKSTDSIV